MALSTKFSKETPDILPGFVVNVHDAINFDIDLSFTSSQRYHYRHVIQNDYKYKEEASDEAIKNRKAYRCRLKGIQLSSSSHKGGRGKSNTMAKATTDMEHMIDRSNGWVICVIDSVDVYNRLLIDLIDPALYPEKYASYSELLFAGYPHLFSKYVPQHHSSSVTSPKRRHRSRRY